MNLYLLQHCLERSAARTPDKVAVVHGGHSLTYTELERRSRVLGEAIGHRVSGAGERIAILTDKCVEQVVSIFGVLYAHHIFVIINPILREQQIRHILRDCHVRLVITKPPFTDSLRAICSESDAPSVLDLDGFDYSACAVPSEPAHSRVGCDISNIIYTSGSTGLPKGIVITHRGLIEGAEIVGSYLGIVPEDRILALPPFNFDYGLNQLTSAVYAGSTLVLFDYTVPNALLETLETQSITGLPALPAVWSSVFDRRLCAIESCGRDFSRLRYISNTGGKLPVPIIHKIRQTFKETRLFLMYGLTEAFRSTFLDPGEVDRRPESIGKAIPNVQIEVVDENGNICPPGTPGELIHRGACIAAGYWNDPQRTAAVYRPNPLLAAAARFMEHVVYSGDLVMRDEEGFLYFVGRRDSMIKTSGYRVSPTEVEDVLLGHDAVTDAIVFGLADDTLGEKIRGIVTVCRDVEPDEIIAYCRSRVAFYLVPRELFIEPAFPKTASGKTDRPRVRAASISKHGN